MNENYSIQGLHGLFWGIHLSEIAQAYVKENPNTDFPTFEAFLRSKTVSSLSTELKDVLDQLETILNSETPILEKIQSSDKILLTSEKTKFLKDFVVDLFMIDHLSTIDEDQKEAYFESEDWQAIEDKTLERGTELINILTYLQEVSLENQNPSLDDFLEEFLMIEDEDYQEDLQFYEDFIAHKDLLEEPIQTMIPAFLELADHSDLGAFILVLACFFRNPAKSDKSLMSMLKQAPEESEAAALLCSLSFCYPGKKAFPEFYTA